MLEIGTSGLMSGEGKRASVLRLYRASPRLYKLLKTKETQRSNKRGRSILDGCWRTSGHRFTFGASVDISRRRSSGASRCVRRAI